MKKTSNIIAGVCLPVTTLADYVYQYGQYLKCNFSREDLSEDGDGENAGGDMRLQVLPAKEFGIGSWRTWEGDNQFDTNHRGMWANAFVPYGCTRKEAREIAENLIAECE